MKLLIADDDVGLCQLLQQHFALDGLQLDLLHRGDLVLPALQGGDYQLLILDITLPGKNGLDVLREVRQAGNLPVLMLSARGEEIDRVLGLEMGADDYLAKPFSPRELGARVRSILRRTQAPAGTEPAVLRVGDLELHPTARQVYRAGQRIELTGAEFSVLQPLLQAAGQVVNKRDLFQQALGRRFQAFDRSLDTHISNLRKKLGAGPDGQPRIQAVRGSGYVYVLPP